MTPEQLANIRSGLQAWRSERLAPGPWKPLAEQYEMESHIYVEELLDEVDRLNAELNMFEECELSDGCFASYDDLPNGDDDLRKVFHLRSDPLSTPPAL
jgi:hypothetical protein